MADSDPQECPQRQALEKRLADAGEKVKRVSIALRAGKPGISADTASAARKTARDAQAALRAHIAEHGCGPK